MKLTPQEKKELSYKRDRRNDYGENDKASRNAIPLRKRLAARAIRRTAAGHLAKNAVSLADEDIERAEGNIRIAERKTRSAWRKFPDVPLGEYLARKAERRERRATDAE